MGRRADSDTDAVGDFSRELHPRDDSGTHFGDRPPVGDDATIVGYSDALRKRNSPDVRTIYPPQCPLCCADAAEELGGGAVVGDVEGDTQGDDSGTLLIDGERVPEVDYRDLVVSIYQLTDWWAARRDLAAQKPVHRNFEVVSNGNHQIETSSVATRLDPRDC